MRDHLTASRTAISVFEYLDYRLYLEGVYRSLKGKLKPYSYLRYSEDLGFSKTNVIHLIIKGKRPLSEKAASKVIQSLALEGVEKDYFLTLVRYQNARLPDAREKLFCELIKLKSSKLESVEGQNQLDFFSDWYHVIIYQMCFLQGFVADPREIAKAVRPNIRPEQARKSLHLLQILGLIKFDVERDCYVPTKLRVSTGDEVASIAVIRYHQKMIELAKESITSVAEEERDVSSVSISIESKMIPQLKEEISSFRKRILALTDHNEKRNDKVYQMNIQLFPTTELNRRT